MTPQRRPRSLRPLLPTASALAAVAAIAALSGCAGFPDGAAMRTTVHWDDRAAAEADDSDGMRVPGLVPDDATDLDLRYDLRHFGAWLRFDSASDVQADYCETGALTGDPAADADWWPTTLPDDGLLCGWWSAFESDGAWYVWDTRVGTDNES